MISSPLRHATPLSFTPPPIAFRHANAADADYFRHFFHFYAFFRFDAAIFDADAPP